IEHGNTRHRRLQKHGIAANRRPTEQRYVIATEHRPKRAEAAEGLNVLTTTQARRVRIESVVDVLQCVMGALADDGYAIAGRLQAAVFTDGRREDAVGTVEREPSIRRTIDGEPRCALVPRLADWRP